MQSRILSLRHQVGEGEEFAHRPGQSNLRIQQLQDELDGRRRVRAFTHLSDAELNLS
jgi:hypothetical protein